MKVTAVILAGGKSSRFGSDKSLLYWGDKRIVEGLAEECSRFAQEVLIVSNQSAKFGLPGIREISDRYPGMGPLGGLHAGLMEAAHEEVFVTACDMPLLDGGLAAWMLRHLDGYHAVVPRQGDRLQPLFSGFLKKQALPAAELLLQRGERKMGVLFRGLRTCYWACPRQEIFYNINYPADYERLLAGERKDACG